MAGLVRHLVEALRSAVYQVVAASDGRVGLDTFKATSCAISLYIIDQVMPTMDGLTSTKSLRALGVKTPILLLTTERSTANNAAAKAAGASGVLAKTFDPQKLMETARRAIG